jgi:hypothetical protein
VLNKETLKYQEARQSLPEDLRAVFDQLAEEYYFYTVAHHGRGYVAYQVLASLVLTGWRPSAEDRSKSVPD